MACRIFFAGILMILLSPASRVLGQGDPAPTEPTAISCVAFSSGSKLLASADSDGNLRMWTVDQPGKSQSVGSHGSYVHQLRFGHSGRMLVSAGRDNRFVVWNLSSGTVSRVLTSPLYHQPEGTHYFRDMVLAPDGSSLTAAIYAWKSQRGVVERWNLSTGKEVDSSMPIAGGFQAMAFSADRSHLAVVAADRRTVLVVDTLTGKTVHQLSGFRHTVHTVAFSPDGTRIASASGAGTSGRIIGKASLPSERELTVWDTTTTEPLLRLTGEEYDHTITQLQFAGNHRLVTLGRDESRLKVWDLHTAKPIANLLHRGKVVAFATSGDGRHLASTGERDKVIHLWDLTAIGSSDKPIKSQKLH